jgi:hypothetical protein
MTNPTFNSVQNGTNAERLVAEYRETIIKLEAHGLPEERGALWDVLGNMLADMKRQQASIQPPDTSTL